MSKKIITPVKPFEDILSPEYKELAHKGPYKEPKSVKDLGTFKEIIEQHPHCAGCGESLAIRLVAATLPAPEDTIIIGSPGCSFFSLTQTAVHYATSAFGNQNAVASGLKRMLKIRYPDKHKDVIVLVGDGAIADGS